MPYVSELIGRPVVDMDGNQMGRLKDLVARYSSGFPHPVVEALVVNYLGRTWVIPYSAVAAMVSAAISIKWRVDSVHPYSPVNDDIYLARDVLDKQIIDIEGARVVRVNDLELLRVNTNIYVSNVDVSSVGLLRRLGLFGLARRISKGAHLRIAQNRVSWNDVELLRGDQSMRLRVPVNKIHDLHPADVAEIISDLSRVESEDFLEALDVEHLADALEEVEPDFQATLIEGMPDEKVADILEEMEPDEAADLLAELPKERSEDLLALMEREEASDVRRLLAYPEDTAGGIMTTEYAAVRSDLTAEQAIVALRALDEEPEMMFYVYVVDADDRLTGVFSLSRLIFSPPQASISEFMSKRVVTVGPYDEQNDVAQVIAKYDLLAVPVVDEENHLQGIVTADDALDKIIPTAWKKRLPRFYR
jgi:magnesium transporter